MNRSTTSTIGTQTLLRGTCRRRRSEDSAENYSPPRRNGRIDRAGKVEVSRGGSQVGWVSVFETAAEWLLQIGRIFLFEDYRFEKEHHEAGEYQPRSGLFRTESLFAAFPDKEIRENPGREQSAWFSLCEAGPGSVCTALPRARVLPHGGNIVCAESATTIHYKSLTFQPFDEDM